MRKNNMELQDYISIGVDLFNIFVIVVLAIVSRRNYTKDRLLRNAERAYILAYRMNEPTTTEYKKRANEFIEGARFTLPDDVYRDCLDILNSKEADIPNKIVMRIVEYKLTL